MTWGNFKEDSVSESYKKMKAEELKGNQHKLDKNKNGEVDSHDFKLLRKEDAVEEGVNKSEIPAYQRKDDKLTLADLEKERTQNKSHSVQLAKNNGTTQKEETELVEYETDKNGRFINKAKPGVYGGSEKEKHVVDTLAGPKSKDLDDIEKKKKIKKEGLELFSEKEIDSLISEVLKANDDAGKWISDFVNSDDPKFDGDSTEQRKKRALGAYYAAQKNESVDYDSFLEEATFDKAAFIAAANKKASADYWKTHAELKKYDPRTAKSTDKPPVKEEVEDSDESIEEATQGDIVKMNAKAIKHANVKDKDDEKDVMEPNSEGEADFLDKHSVQVTDEPAAAAANDQTGKSKVSTATGPKGQGAGKYDGKGKTGIKEDAAKAKSCGCTEDCSCKEGTSKKSYTTFKEKMNKKGC
jgi:hypothetical protein